MKKVFLFLICSLSTLFLSYAQNIDGKLIDEQQQPLPYANIVLLTLPDSVFVNGTVSNEMGIFHIAKSAEGKLLRISSVGYATIYRPCETATDLGVIRMEADTQIMGEVVVKAELPITRAKGDAMVTTVAGSILEKAGNGNQLLDKIPNVSSTEGNVNVFGSGVAVVYINGRKMRNPSELEQLSSDDIKSVEVVQNPGARYDAEVKAVVRIFTKKRQGEGFGFRNTIGMTYRYDWSENEQTDLNWRKEGFDLSGRLTFNNSRSKSEKTITQDTYLDNHWKQESDFINKFSFQNLSTMFSANYQLNENHSFGVRYDYYRNPKAPKMVTAMTTDVNCDDTPYERTQTAMNSRNYNFSHDLNLYYVGKLKMWTIDFNADGSWGNTDNINCAEEDIQDGKGDAERTVTSTGGNDYTLYATKLLFSHPLVGGELTIGSEYAYTDRLSTYRNVEGILNDDQSEITENALAVFADYNRTLGKVQTQVGVRYEHITSDYYEQGVKSNDQSRKYNHFFPSVSMSFPIGKVQMQFGYRASISRPNYANLQSNVFYANHYTYESGNPMLQSTTIQKLTMSAVYRWLYLGVGFRRYRNGIISTICTYSDDLPTVGLNTFKNVAPYNDAYASLQLTPKLGIWQPHWSVQVSQTWFTADTPQGKKEFDNPLATLGWRNNFRLSNNFLIDVNFFFKTKGQSENVEIMADSWWMNASIYKSFLKNRLSIQFQVQDIFQTLKSHLRVYSGLRVSDYDEAQRRMFSLTLRYNLNTSKSKYKGTGAGQSQKSRM